MGFETDEYNSVYHNYTYYDYLKPLILKIELIPTTETPLGLRVKWIETVEDLVYVSPDGWYVDTNKGSKYPTFESLAMHISNEFNQRWGTALFKKLQALEQEL